MLALAQLGGDRRVGVGQAAPTFTATTLDGATLSLDQLRGRPVVLNFWGPSCIPCREEFPLLIDEAAAHEADGLAIVGVLTFDPPEPARDFAAQYGATWPTVIDPDESIRGAYLVAARPQTYFIDRDGVIRAIQIGEMLEADFDRHWAKISG